MIADLNQCDRTCLSCIKNYKDKHTLKIGQKFEVRCNGIPKDRIPSSILATIKPEERDVAQGLLDPVTWAAQALDWHCLDPDGEIWKRKNPDEYYEWVDNNPDKSILGHSRYHRPYQAEMLRCSSKRKIFRLGRQSGKCLVSGTQIQIANGSHKPIEEVQDGDLVISITDQYKTVVSKAYRACNGIKSVYRIILMDGREIEATGNHPFLSRKRIGRETTESRRAIFKDEWIEAEDLTTDDHLAVPVNISVGPIALSGSWWPGTTILGCMLADGNITGNNCRFSNTNPVILDYLREAVGYLDCSLKHYDCDADNDYHIVGQGSGKLHRVKDLFRKVGLQGLDSHQKFIPECFMSWQSNEDIAQVLRCMFGCDGWASVGKDNSVEIGYSTVSEKLAFQVVALLSRFGIYADCRSKTVDAPVVLLARDPLHPCPPCPNRPILP